MRRKDEGFGRLADGIQQGRSWWVGRGLEAKAVLSWKLGFGVWSKVWVSRMHGGPAKGGLLSLKVCGVLSED